eukprot:6188729-Pleurochrysis_carterae.AAC.1
MHVRSLMCTHVFAEFARVYLHRVTRSGAARARMFAPIVNANQCHLRSIWTPMELVQKRPLRLHRVFVCTQMPYVCTCATRARRIRNHANHGTSTYTHVHAFAMRCRPCLTACKRGCIALGMLCVHAFAQLISISVITTAAQYKCSFLLALLLALALSGVESYFLK